MEDLFGHGNAPNSGKVSLAVAATWFVLNFMMITVQMKSVSLPCRRWRRFSRETATNLSIRKRVLPSGCR